MEYTYTYVRTVLSTDSVGCEVVFAPVYCTVASTLVVVSVAVVYLQFNWLTFMKGYFKEVGKEDLITNDTIVNIDTPRYFGNLTTVLNKFTTE